MDTDHDARALARFDTFLFSAVATVLVVRTFLAVTGYPQVGSGGLHIAHVLWGGLFMAVAIVLVEIVPGSRAELRAAFVGGIGFGLFIDEVGKFVTKDVDYFFKPAIAIIYAVFVAFYVIGREVLLLRKLTDRRRVAIAATALADLALGQLDRASRDHAVHVLDAVAPSSALRKTAESVRAGLLARPRPQSGLEAWLTRGVDRVHDFIDGLLGSRFVQRTIVVLFAVAAADVVVSFVVPAVDRGSTRVSRILLDTGLPSAVSAALIVAGVVRLRAHRRQGLLLLQWSVLVQLLFTQVMVFYREQWLGLIGFIVDLLLLGALRQALHEPPGAVLPGSESDDKHRDDG